MRFVLVAHVPAGGTEAFRDYERAVIPLLAAHRGTLEHQRPLTAAAPS